MYERSYGYRYDETAKLSTVEIAKRIRADIKQAIAEGLLRSDAKYSVTSETYSGGCSIDIRVKGWPEAWVPCDGTDGEHICRDVWCLARVTRFNDEAYRLGAKAHDVLSAEAKSALKTLERIHGAYNHDGSDISIDYFDVNYSGQVRFETADDADFHAREAAKKAAKRAAIDEATALGTRRVAVYSRDGKSTIHDAVEVDGRVNLVCGAVLWSRGMVGSTEKPVTCSRCAKKAAQVSS